VVAKVVLACRSLEVRSLEPQGIKLNMFRINTKVSKVTSILAEQLF
jgi:hypothetical protein